MGDRFEDLKEAEVGTCSQNAVDFIEFDRHGEESDAWASVVICFPLCRPAAQEGRCKELEYTSSRNGGNSSSSETMHGI